MVTFVALFLQLHLLWKNKRVLSKSSNMLHSTWTEVNLLVYLFYEVTDLPLGLHSYQQFVILGCFIPSGMKWWTLVQKSFIKIKLQSVICGKNTTSSYWRQIKIFDADRLPLLLLRFSYWSSSCVSRLLTFLCLRVHIPVNGDASTGVSGSVWWPFLCQHQDRR